MSFIAGYLLGLEEGGGANIQPLTVTENKEYNAADYGCDGFNPVVGNVATPEPVIQSKTIRKNGTYTAPDGVDGYSPVIVKNPYETLYKLEHGGGDDIDTNILDDDGNDIIINGEQIDNLNGLNYLINAAVIADAPVETAVSDGTNLIKLKLEIIYTVNGDYEYIDPKFTIENMRNGQSATFPPSFPYYNLFSDAHTVKSGKIDKILTSYAGFHVVFRNTKGGVGLQTSGTISYSKIGITEMDTKKLKYYILGGV